MNIIEKQCANCGRKFYTRDRNKAYCNTHCEECAKDGVKVEVKEPKEHPTDYKVCIACGEMFFRKPRVSKVLWEKRKFCSKSCKAWYFHHRSEGIRRNKCQK